MNAASRLMLDIARQDLADKMARAELHAQRREARSINHLVESAQPTHRHAARLRLFSRQA